MLRVDPTVEGEADVDVSCEEESLADLQEKEPFIDLNRFEANAKEDVESEIDLTAEEESAKTPEVLECTDVPVLPPVADLSFVRFRRSKTAVRESIGRERFIPSCTYRLRVHVFFS